MATQVDLLPWQTTGLSKIKGGVHGGNHEETVVPVWPRGKTVGGASPPWVNPDLYGQLTKIPRTGKKF